MNDKYSQNAIAAFGVLFSAYIAIVLLLIFLESKAYCQFSNSINNLDGFLFCLPMIAFYLMVLIAATAGYARGKYMLKELPFNKRLDQELKEKTMARGSIKTKIRAGAQVLEDDKFSDTLNKLVSSRISILAVVDRENRVKGAITSTDLLIKIQEAIKNGPDAVQAINDLQVKDMYSPRVTSSECDDTLNTVMNKMLQNQYTKLIIVNSDNTFAGTIDAMDLMAELYEGVSG